MTVTVIRDAAGAVLRGGQSRYHAQGVDAALDESGTPQRCGNALYEHSTRGLSIGQNAPRFLELRR